MANVLTVILNGKTATQIVNLAKTQFTAKDTAGFNIGACAYVFTGNELPAFGEYGAVSLDKDSRGNEKEFATLVDRDYKTVNRILNAFKLVVESGHFVDFASGLIKFNYDKVFKVLPNLETVFKDDDIYDIFALSYKRILRRIEDYEQEQADAEDADEQEQDADEQASEQEAEQEQEQDKELVSFTYEGKEYSVSKSAMEALLAQAVEITK